MMNVNGSVSIGAGAAAVALVGTLVVGSTPVLAGLTVAGIIFGGLGYVAFVAQSRRFDDVRRFVYRPVYVPARNVHPRVSSYRD